MKKRTPIFQKIALLSVLTLALTGCNSDKSSTDNADATKTKKEAVELLNVSYDPTRELYDEFNKDFIAKWKEEHEQDVTIHQSHGGSGKQ